MVAHELLSQKSSEALRKLADGCLEVRDLSYSNVSASLHACCATYTGFINGGIVPFRCLWKRCRRLVLRADCQRGKRQVEDQLAEAAAGEDAASPGEAPPDAPEACGCADRERSRLHLLPPAAPLPAAALTGALPASAPNMAGGAHEGPCFSQSPIPAQQSLVQSQCRLTDHGVTCCRRSCM